MYEYLILFVLLSLFIIHIIFESYEFIFSKTITNNHQPTQPIPAIQPIPSNQTDLINQIINKFKTALFKKTTIPYVIGICGGSGSGKTLTSQLISEAILKIYSKANKKDIIIISQDSYYKGGDSKTNFDDPDSIEFTLLINQLKNLIDGKKINQPIYNFATRKRTKEIELVEPGKVIIVEGILIFQMEELRKLFDIKIFIEADTPTQIFRRIFRDVNERGRLLEDISKQYVRDVWPAYKSYIEPSMRHADVIINNFNGCFVGPQIVLNHIVMVLKNIFE